VSAVSPQPPAAGSLPRARWLVSAVYDAAAGCRAKCVGHIRQAGRGRAGCPGAPGVGSDGDRGKAQRQGGADPGDQRLPAGTRTRTGTRTGDDEGAVGGDVGRGGQRPLGAPSGADEQLPEQVRPGRGAHRDGCPGRSLGGERRGERQRDGRGRGRGRGGGGRAAGTAGAPSGQTGGENGGREDGRDAPGPGHDDGPGQDDARIWLAASASCVANEDWVAAVPGPGSKSSSWRMFPLRSMTKASSLCPSIAPAGRVSEMTP
jgi:hypothetical protein